MWFQRKPPYVRVKAPGLQGFGFRRPRAHRVGKDVRRVRWRRLLSWSIDCEAWLCFAGRRRTARTRASCRTLPGILCGKAVVSFSWRPLANPAQQRRPTGSPRLQLHVLAEMQCMSAREPRIRVLGCCRGRVRVCRVTSAPTRAALAYPRNQVSGGTLPWTVFLHWVISGPPLCYSNPCVRRMRGCLPRS